MIAANKGEWSELYVLLRLLADGKLYAADEDLTRMENVYSPILKVFRQEFESGRMEYVLQDSKHEVELYINGDKIKSLSSERLAGYAEAFYRGIQKGSRSSFQIDDAEMMMEDIRCRKIKAPSEDKTDIKVQLYDRKTGYRSIVGYSIKSELGNAPTLLNASQSTNFRFELSDLTSDEIQAVNAIETKAKIQDRLKAIEEIGTLRFDRVVQDTFLGNLMLVDSMMEEILSFMLIEYYRNGKVLCSDIATAVEQKDPLGYHREGIYRYKIKKFLCAVALGMVPSRRWDGQDEANGGYIIVKEDGEVLAYHLYNRNSFENYLLNHTKLDTGSSGRNRFGSIYEENGHQYFNLNLQVRFV